MWRVLPEE
jgi:hypothetical protein